MPKKDLKALKKDLKEVDKALAEQAKKQATSAARIEKLNGMKADLEAKIAELEQPADPPQPA
jgi:septal ring factor EnvC (AmiA/AmiB activator)